MNTIANLWTRREFLKTGSLWGAQFLLGGLSGSLLVEAKPNHHTEKGFRNDPPTPDLTPDFGFMLRRFRGSFSLPEVPPDHSLSEEAAIAQLNEHVSNEAPRQNDPDRPLFDRIRQSVYRRAEAICSAGNLHRKTASH